MSIQFWENLTFWLFLSGLAGDVIIAIIAAVNVHNKNLSESTKHKFEKVLEWSAALSAVLVLFAILAEHHADKLRNDYFHNQIQSIKSQEPRSLTPMDQLALVRSFDWMPNKLPIQINLSPSAKDGENLGNQLKDIFSNAGFAVDSISLGMIFREEGKRGIIVGATNKSFKEFVFELNEFGLLATNDENLVSSNKIFIDVEPK